MVSLRRIFLSLIVIGFLGLLLVSSSDRPQSAKAAHTLSSLEADQSRRWYRGNLHTHSLWSDGDDYPEMIAAWYKEHGYDFLVFTDHNVLHRFERWTDVDRNKGKRIAYEKLVKKFGEDWVEERTKGGRLEVRLKRFDEVSRKLSVPGKYLLIQGEEISDRFQKYPIHLNAANVLELIPPMHGTSVSDTIQNNVNVVIKQKERTGRPMMIHLNHPNFGYAVTAEDLMRIRGEKFFEVYNGHPGVRNSGDPQHASTERLWDIVLSKRLGEFGLPVMYGLAVDDGHNYHKIPSRGSEPGRGWVMVLAKSLSPKDLIEAMEAGQFYATSGVALKSVTSTDELISVEIEPKEGVDYQIEFVGTKLGVNLKGKPVVGADGKPIRATQIYSPKVGEVLKTVKGLKGSYQFQGDEYYVRARITSTRKHPNPSEVGEFEKAWTQPVVGPAAVPIIE